MKTLFISKKIILILAIVVTLALAATTILLNQGVSPESDRKEVASGSQGLTEVVIAAQDAAISCAGDDVLCYNNYASDIFNNQGAKALYLFIDEVIELRQDALDCRSWLFDLGSKLYVRNGSEVFNKDANSICRSAMVAGGHIGVGEKSNSENLLTDGSLLCDAVGISKYECSFYTGFSALKQSNGDIKVALGTCDKLIDRLASRNCGTGVAAYSQFMETKKIGENCAALKSPAAAGCAKIIALSEAIKGGDLEKICAPFMEIAKDDCEYSYGYFIGASGGKTSACLDSSWCARGVGWGVRITESPESAKKICAEMPESLKRGCTAGSEMTITPSQKTPDRPEPLNNKNHDGKLPTRS